MDIEQEVVTGAEVPESEAAPKSTYDVVREAMDAADMKFSNDPIAKKGPEDEAAAQAAKNRDESGRFAKKDGQEVVDKPVAAGPANTAITAKDNPESQIVQASTPVEAPAGWPSEAKAQWSQLSPAIQAAVVKRETEINEGGRRWSEEKRQYEETLTPLRATVQRYGMNERDGLQKLLAANDFLERDPRAAIQFFATHYGVDLQNLNQQPQQPQIDPNIAAIIQEVSTLKNTLQTREQQDTEAEISRFRDNGHPHLDTVRVLMGNLLSTGQASDMEDAYQKAIWATPDIRTQLIAEQSTAATNAARDKELDRTNKARRAAVSLNGGPGNGSSTSPQQKYADGREAARAAMEEHGL